MIVFDIETGPLPDEELLVSLPEFDPSSVKVGGLGTEKAAEKIAKAKDTHRDNWFDKAALNPITGQVVAIGYLIQRELIVKIEDNEKELLQVFWSNCIFSDSFADAMVGHNSNRFDVPFMVRRSWLIGVEVPSFVIKVRYLSSTFVDLMEMWQCGDKSVYISLDNLAKAFGLQGKLEDVDGKDFHKLLKTDPEKAKKYLCRDIELTHDVAVRMGVV